VTGSTRRTRLSSAAALAAAGLLLTGCAGSTGPGVAASVGEAAISLAHVDQLTEDYCEARRDGYTADAVAVPMALLRTQVVQSLVAREVATQIGEQYDVSAGTTYKRQVNALRKEMVTFPDAAAQARIEVESVNGYVQDILFGAAEQQLADEGKASPSSEAVQRRAVEIFGGWGAEHPVAIDSRFGITFQEGTFAPADGDGLSHAVGEAATRASVLDDFAAARDQAEQQALQQQVVDYAHSLPANQRCG
jgi:hypothetical protein